jgi:hypothetical protein
MTVTLSKTSGTTAAGARPDTLRVLIIPWAVAMLLCGTADNGADIAVAAVLHTEAIASAVRRKRSIYSERKFIGSRRRKAKH